MSEATKPAGCAMQLLALPLILGGGITLGVGATNPEGVQVGSVVLGAVLFVLGFWLLKRGR